MKNLQSLTLILPNYLNMRSAILSNIENTEKSASEISKLLNTDRRNVRTTIGTIDTNLIKSITANNKEFRVKYKASEKYFQILDILQDAERKIQDILCQI